MTPRRETYEKLGAFYLGKEYDADKGEMTDDLLLYDSKDLLTHGVCVGMTGSGKTGLCISLLEEAAIDNVPALVIDPKGDLANLLLTFPDLAPDDFRPWIDAGTAERKGQTPDEFAAGQAKLWKEGLASWGEDGERIARLKASADFSVYTPGSEAGLPISILSSFGAPPPAVLEDNDLLSDRVSSTVSSLLGLLGIDADPLRSREHILLSNLLDHGWRQGQDYDLGSLIQAIQKPPMKKIGVFDLESFFPDKDRFELAMLLNNLLAAPGFQTWFSGEPLEIDSLLFTDSGKPRITIFSIAHLSEPERMFFVSLLLNQTLAWMRQRPGSSSLQAILYMDEVFGFMPPVANPPSKTVLLTLLKQARAYGLGVVLATQNPMDLDYKGLSNMGTWFLGRLQTERDKLRILDGLEGASGGDFDRQKMERLLSGLGKRVFLLYNVHEDGPVLFHTRWAMSYLRGPMTRVEIQSLMADKKALAARQVTAEAPPARRTAKSTPAPKAAAADLEPRPSVPTGVTEAFLPVRSRIETVFYEPHLLATTTISCVDTRKGLEHTEEKTFMVPLDPDALRVDWDDAVTLELTEEELEREPEEPANFGPLPTSANKKTSFTTWKRELKSSLYRNQRYELFKSALLKEISEPGESERDFRIRLTSRMREERDEATEKLRAKYGTKVARLEERIRKAFEKVEKEKEQAKHQKFQTAISFGMTAISALFGRKALSRSNVGRAGTAMRGVARSARESQDVDRAEENVEVLQRQLAELNAELEQEIDTLTERYDPQGEELDTVVLKPRKTDINIHLLALAWAPYGRGKRGGQEAAW
ncbi:MAG: DUF87 domain-containing protein [Deltaproteobacteria bacterium]|nr:DUF87 domain-containing protein [Deltaproteobacteria bacterium]